MSEGVKPFNDFFLKTCYDTFVLSQLTINNESINGFLKNYKFNTSKKGNECQLTLEVNHLPYERVQIITKKNDCLNEINKNLEFGKFILIVNSKDDRYCFLLGKENDLYLMLNQKVRGSQSFDLENITIKDLKKIVACTDTSLYLFKTQKRFYHSQKLIYNFQKDLVYFLDFSLKEYKEDLSSLISYDSANNLLNLIRILKYFYKEDRKIEYEKILKELEKECLKFRYFVIKGNDGKEEQLDSLMKMKKITKNFLIEN